MRARRLAVLIALLLAAPALAQPTPTPPPKPTPQASAPRPAPAVAAPTPLPAPAPFSGPSLPPRSPLPGVAADAAAAQCTAQCSRTYYACLAGDDAASCPGDWAQCRVSCGNAARRSVNPGMSAGR